VFGRRYDIRKYFFVTGSLGLMFGTACRIVVETDSVNAFKSRLDKYWANQEFVFNFNSELIGTGRLPDCM